MTRSDTSTIRPAVVRSRERAGGSRCITPTESRTRSGKRLALVALVLVLVGHDPRSASAAETDATWPLDRGFARLARDLAPGDAVVVSGIPFLLNDQGAAANAAPAPATLRLERYDVFTPDAKILVHRDASRFREVRDHTVYFRGTVAEVPGSVVAVAVRDDGSIDGRIAVGERFFKVQKAPALDVAELREIEPSAALEENLASWDCGSDRISTALGLPSDTNAASSAVAPTFTPVYNVEIAIDTDVEYTQRFSSPSDATSWIGTMFTFLSGIYLRDVGVNLVISHLDVRTGSTTSDPWNATGNTFPALLEFGNWWHANRASVSRDLAHFLSGKILGGGIAWLEQLCAPDTCFECVDAGCNSFSACTTARPDNWYGGYGVSANLDGRTSLTEHVWDLIVVSHEIGHNFSSHHTHCYNPPVDQCWGREGGCYIGPESVPSGGGSIMSYCHQRPGGLSNVFLNFGAAGRFGNQSTRVPAKMRSHVDARSACFTTGPTPTPPTPTPTPTPNPGTLITCGQTVTGQLTAGDAGSTVRPGSRADAYAFDATAGQQVTITMTRGTLADPYLGLFSPNGVLIATDDDSAGNLNARITMTLASAGRRRFEATALHAATAPGGLGTYSVTLTCALSPPTNLTAVAASSSSINLTWSDRSSGESGFRIQRRLGTGGKFAQIATVGANVQSFTDTGLDPGTRYVYRVRAFTSTARSGFSNKARATTSGGGGAMPITCGQTLAGQLTTSDPASVIRPGSRADAYVFTASAGQQVVITMTRGTVGDPFLGLFSPSGVLIATDDDSAGSLNARIVMTLASPGARRFEATTYSSNAGTGTYSVTLTCP